MAVILALLASPRSISKDGEEQSRYSGGDQESAEPQTYLKASSEPGNPTYNVLPIQLSSPFGSQ